MAKEKAEMKEDCKCENKCDCGSECKCGCGCGCGCKKKLFMLLVLIIVFLAGIGCGCLMCCGMGCKSHHRMPAPIAMAKHTMAQPKNNVIIIRTDGDEVVPEVASVNGDFRNLKKHHKKHHRAFPPMPEAPVAPEVQAPAAEVALPAPAEAPAEAPVSAPVE